MKSLTHKVLLALAMVAGLAMVRTAVADDKPTPINTVCPIAGKPLNPEKEITLNWEGKTIGFCCPNCEKKFEAMSTEEKTAKLTAAIEQGLDVKSCPISHHKINPMTAEVFEGKQIAFCCENCVKAWSKLSTAEKETKVAAVAK